MKIYKLIRGILIEHGESYYLLEDKAWGPFINDDGLYDKIEVITSSPSQFEMVLNL